MTTPGDDTTSVENSALFDAHPFASSSGTSVNESISSFSVVSGDNNKKRKANSEVQSDGLTSAGSATSTHNEPEACRIYPASFNWYCAKISSCNKEGLLAFGARNAIYILDVRSRKITATLTGHTNKVTSVVFSPSLQNICYSSSADKTVRVWDVILGQCLYVLNGGSVHKVEIAAVALSPLTTDLIVSADVSGHVHSWRYLEASAQTPVSTSTSATNNSTITSANNTSNKIITATASANTSFCPLANAGKLFTIACSSYDATIAAIGYQSGAIVLVDIVGRNILKRLIGHVDEIHGLSWCKETSDGVKKLATASRDKTIRIWDTTTGKSLHNLQLPKPQQQQQKSDKSRLWVTVQWNPKDANQLLTSSHDGDVLRWNISSARPTPFKFQARHNRPVFNIHYFDASNITEKFVVRHRKKKGKKQTSTASDSMTFAITLSMDRTIGFWDVNLGQCFWVVPGIGGYVYSMDASDQKYNPNGNFTNLALGIGDNSIRVWRHRTANIKDPYDGLYLWKGVQGKVTCVRYHPLPPSAMSGMECLAFGTEDGRLGLYDTGASRLINLFSHYHKGPVYDLDWRLVNKNEGRYSLFSCGGDGVIFETDPESIEGKRAQHIDINTLIAKMNGQQKFSKRSALSCKEDGSILIIGNRDGSIEIYKLPAYESICKVHHHHKAINRIRWHPSSSDTSYNSWFATASEDSTIRIYNLQTLDSDTSTSFQVLQGHSNAIASICWSPHDSELILSGSFDGTAQVWNARTGQPLVNFRGHEGRVLCVAWSTIHDNIVFTGSEDFSVRVWNTKLQTYDAPPGRVAFNRPRRRVEDKEGENAVSQKPKEFDSKLSELPDCLYLAKKKNTQISDGDELNLFLDTKAAMNYLYHQVELNQKNGKHELASLLQYEAGDVSHALQRIVNEGLISPFWISLSPSVGGDAWLKMMSLYSKQLEAKKEIHQAAVIQLACQQPLEAINIYKRASMFKDAVLLAKIRLSFDDSLISDLLLSWAEHLQQHAAFVKAAKCFLGINEFNRAINCLMLKGDKESLKTACEISYIGSCASASLFRICGLECQEHGEWEEASKMFSSFPELSGFKFLLGVEVSLALYSADIIDIKYDIKKLHTTSGNSPLVLHLEERGLLKANYLSALTTLLSRLGISDTNDMRVQLQSIESDVLKSRKSKGIALASYKIGMALCSVDDFTFYYNWLEAVFELWRNNQQKASMTLSRILSNKLFSIDVSSDQIEIVQLRAVVQRLSQFYYADILTNQNNSDSEVQELNDPSRVISMLLSDNLISAGLEQQNKLAIDKAWLQNCVNNLTKRNQDQTPKEESIIPDETKMDVVVDPVEPSTSTNPNPTTTDVEQHPQ